MNNHPAETVRFGRFELDTALGRLRKDGAPIRMRHQTLQLLLCLVEHSGSVVTRNTLAQRLWGDADIDFDQRLNAAVRDLRKTLDDDCDGPGMIQTVPRKGYRFTGRLGKTPRQRRRFAWGATILVVAGLSATAYLLKDENTAEAIPAHARDLYVEAVGLLDQNDAARYERIERLLAEAISEAPGYAPAWSALAKLWCYKPVAPGEKLPQARKAALRAMELDADSVEARLRLADIAVSWDRDWPLAETYLREAADIEPGGSAVHHALASLHYLQGRIADGEAAMQTGLAIDPLSMVLHTDLAWYYTVSGDYEKALEVCALIERIEPDPKNQTGCALHPNLLLGRLTEAAQIARETLEQATGQLPGADLSDADLLRLYWQTALQHLNESNARQYVDPVYLARVHAQLGHPAETLEWLEKAVEVRSMLAPYIHLFPEFRGLHGQPRFAALLKRIGFPDDPQVILARLRDNDAV